MWSLEAPPDWMAQKDAEVDMLVSQPSEHKWRKEDGPLIRRCCVNRGGGDGGGEAFTGLLKFNPRSFPWHGYYYHLHFTNEENEAHGGGLGLRVGSDSKLLTLHQCSSNFSRLLTSSIVLPRCTHHLWQPWPCAGQISLQERQASIVTPSASATAEISSLLPGNDWAQRVLGWSCPMQDFPRGTLCSGGYLPPSSAPQPPWGLSNPLLLPSLPAQRCQPLAAVCSLSPSTPAPFPLSSTVGFLRYISCTSILS